MKKIKIFLGAYVNFPNAQNVNCDYIAKHLDKDKFEVHIMYTDKMPIDKKKYEEQGIILHRLIHRRYIWFWSKLFAMWYANADIYYMPKLERQDAFFARIFKRTKKVFVSSVEGVIKETINNSEEAKKFFLQIMDSTFVISECISKSVRERWGVDLPILPLGVETLSEGDTVGDTVSSVIWIGNIKENKRPQFLLECAMKFPDLKFTMVGDGELETNIRQIINEKKLKNVTLTGRIKNTEVYEYLKRSDLLLMTSKYEGLPKVIQEAAQCGVPCVYINEEYSVDFIEDGVNGYAVSNIDEMIGRLKELVGHSETYKKMARNAYQIIQKYTWKNLIKDYENYFMLQYKKKQEN